MLADPLKAAPPAATLSVEVAPATAPRPRRRILRQYELIERVRAYEPDADEDALNRAYVYAVQKHGTQTRDSGDPYFSHPVEVAGILTQLKLDSSVIIAGLLHDVIEDTDATLDEIRGLFGDQVAEIVDGVTKLAKFQFTSDSERQVENFLKLLVAMSRDLRVLLVKLADRLHNMRTLGFVKSPERRARIARETLEIYAPLAERIGMGGIEAELEEVAFAELHPAEHDDIAERLKQLRADGAAEIEHLQAQLATVINDAGVEGAEVQGREKSPYSIWRKMQRKATTFEQLSDLMAFRVLVNSQAECYAVLGAVNGRYNAVPGRFKDYISTPKANGYRSLHTTVIAERGRRIEVQIRTRAMHDVAERGVAAHWAYKTDVARKDVKRWLEPLIEILKDRASAEDRLADSQRELFADQVYCFTPRGEVIVLPRGSTPIDFAYAIHSDVGDHCASALIAGRMVPLDTVLRNGDEVEIRTQANIQPTQGWLAKARSGRALARIRRYLRERDRVQLTENGRVALDGALKAVGAHMDEATLQPAIKAYRLPTMEDLFFQVGGGTVPTKDVLQRLGLKLAPPAAKPVAKPVAIIPAARPDESRGDYGLIGLPKGVPVHFARCCHPVPGDPVAGIITSGKGITVHAAECATLEAFEATPERWLELSWRGGGEPTGEARAVARLDLTLTRAADAAAELVGEIRKAGARLERMSFHPLNAGYARATIDVAVDGTKALTRLMSQLQQVPVVVSVERQRQGGARPRLVVVDQAPAPPPAKSA